MPKTGLKPVYSIFEKTKYKTSRPIMIRININFAHRISRQLCFDEHSIVLNSTTNDICIILSIVYEI